MSNPPAPSAETSREAIPEATRGIDTRDRSALLAAGRARQAALLGDRAAAAAALKDAESLGMDSEMATEHVDGVEDVHRGSTDNRGQPKAGRPVGQVLSPAQRLAKAREVVEAHERVTKAHASTLARGTKGR